MGTKTISIMDDVYKMLKALKSPDESFSDEIRRLAKTKSNIMGFAGAWSDLTEGEANNMKRLLAGLRKGTRLEEIKGKQ